ncbi:replicative DNA helicase [Pseudomonas juntendi]|uniref:replicative DNA helicase n=1 Tax=Pseudomonas juntendi TaxID=2666183 RepID=UPI001F388EDA|nr:replicative DNA helicase [Pseudomonas juntendi]MCF3155675.1 replicative DNA helicase [Pseudomonas juntendi]
MSELVMGYPEAEHGVLGAIMLASLDGNAALVDDIVSQMTSADFLYDDHAALFDVIRECLDRGLPVDAVTVGDVQRTLPSGQGTLAFAVDLCRNVPSVANAMAYAKQVKQWAVIRQVVDLGHSAKAAVASGLVPDEIIAQAQQSIADLRDLQGSQKAGYRRMAEVLPKVFDGMQEVLDDRAPPKLSTGLADLDKLIGFLRPKSMVVIAGRPGSGKTMLGLQIVNHVAIRGAGVGLIFSLEMDEKELTIRTIASQGAVDLRRMEEVKSLDEDEWQRIGTAGSKIEAAQLYLNDTPGMTMSAIRSDARKLQREKGLDIMMIDYLGLVGTEGRSQNRADAVAKVSIALKNLAKELSVPVLVLAQLNRNPASRPGKKPQASDLRDSGQIEQDADAVILVHHDPESEAGEQGVTELILDKGRQAPQGSCLVQRQGQYARFVNFAGNRLPPDDEVEMGRVLNFSKHRKGSKHRETF